VLNIKINQNKERNEARAGIKTLTPTSQLELTSISLRQTQKPTEIACMAKTTETNKQTRMQLRKTPL